jgi:two-component system chemotaxis sensor kinase CheA
MDSKEKEFLKRLIKTFRQEAEEHIKFIRSNLIEIEKSTDHALIKGTIENIYREAHSLKGAARSVSFKCVEFVCQEIENVFSALKKDELKLSKNDFDLLHNVINKISELINEKDFNNPELEKIGNRLKYLVNLILQRKDEKKISEMIDKNNFDNFISNEKSGKITDSEVKPEKESSFKSEIVSEKNEFEDSVKTIDMSASEKLMKTETVRVAINKIDSLFHQVEELLLTKLSYLHLTEGLKSILEKNEEFDKKISNIKNELRFVKKICENRDSGLSAPERNSIQKFVEFYESYFDLYYKSNFELFNIYKTAMNDSHSNSLLIENLLDEAKGILMLPISTVTDVLPIMVRDLSVNLDKEIEFKIEGNDTVIDRRILDEIKDPLIHLIRNSVDHGIETPKEREAIKKSKSGLLELNIKQISGDKIEIVIIDDGKGIDTQAVLKSAVKKGLITEESASELNELQIFELIFKSDISTSPVITDLSGRGLGLAIVKEKIEKLGGTITLKSEKGKGSTFRLVIPLTLSTFRGVLIRLSEMEYIVPTIEVERLVRINSNEVKTVENKDTITVDGEVIPLMSLKSILGVTSNKYIKSEKLFITAFISNYSGSRVAFIVDDILNEQEILVKNLGSQLANVKNIYGATVLGSGKVVPILNIKDLLEASEVISSKVMDTAQQTAEKPEDKKVLVVDDSVTSRILIKDILESTGYQVKTAVDGVEAFTLLKSEEFDLVVSDVEMPRLNGFDLTAKIRADKSFAELPVVLVTALASKEDREKGIEVGANAYIVKSSFEQSNLLDIIGRLI